MHPPVTTEEIGPKDWREAAEGLLVRARAISRQAEVRVREATGDPQATATLPEEPT